MNERELRELVGDDPRLRRTHEHLVAAGRPPELPAGGLNPPRKRQPRSLERRPLLALIAAVLLAVASFGGGYMLAERGDSDAFPAAYVIELRPTAGAPRASALLEVGELDEAGNWPMTMTVRGLPVLPSGERYELVLTQNRRPAVSCGVFVVEGSSTVVFLNAPYRFSEYDAWAVTRAGDDELLLVAEGV